MFVFASARKIDWAISKTQLINPRRQINPSDAGMRQLLMAPIHGFLQTVMG
jgi:hypothetical protein